MNRMQLAEFLHRIERKNAGPDDTTPNGRSVLQIALDIHTSCTGSNDRSGFDCLLDVVYLKLILERWLTNPTHNSYAFRFDIAVKDLIITALEEYHACSWREPDEIIKAIREMASATFDYSAAHRHYLELKKITRKATD